MLLRHLRIGARARGEVLLHRHTPAEPGVGRVRAVHLLVLTGPRPGERTALGDDTPVYGGHHVADHARASSGARRVTYSVRHSSPPSAHCLEKVTCTLRRPSAWGKSTGSSTRPRRVYEYDELKVA